VIDGRVALDAAVIKDARNVSVLPGAPAGLDHPTDEQIQRQLVDAAHAYDLVLIDGGFKGPEPRNGQASRIERSHKSGNKWSSVYSVPRCGFDLIGNCADSI
jgi:hypothetical protein